MARSHRYETTVTWTGNTGTGTSGYRDYQRTHEISAAGKPTLPGSSDPAFRGDPARWNPEELLVASLSQCHMLPRALRAAGGRISRALGRPARRGRPRRASGRPCRGGARPSAS
jgi:organic hydroperoxide reductase OsmC/OhrA